MRSTLKGLIRSILWLMFCGLAASMAFAQVASLEELMMNRPDLLEPIRAGYAIITPTAGTADGLIVFETFGELRGIEMTQAGVLASDMTTHSILFVNTSGRLSRNLGVAIANPDAVVANISLTLRNEDGTILATKAATVAAHSQSSRFVTELFADQPSVVRDFTGTLELSSDIPVAVIGLRFRGLNFSTLPARDLSGAHPVPLVATGVGGPTAVILPQFAAGGGWATEIVIANTSSSDLTVRVDLFAKDGTPLPATLNGQKKSSFTDIKIPKFGVVTLAPRDNKGDSDF